MGQPYGWKIGLILYWEREKLGNFVCHDVGEHFKHSLHVLMLEVIK